MAVKTLYSCGDSFMSADEPTEARLEDMPRHDLRIVRTFLDLFCERRGIRHVSLARPGATNYVIRLQIDQAIKSGADYVVLCPTSADRFDLPKLIGGVPHQIQLNDVHYHGYHARSARYVSPQGSNDRPPSIVSDVEHNLFSNYHGANLDTDQKNALKHHIAYLHDPALVRHKEHYMMRDALWSLDHHGIDYMFIPGSLFMYDWSWARRTWPRDQDDPYSYILKVGPYPYSVTHNDQAGHDRFCEILETLVAWPG